MATSLSVIVANSLCCPPEPDQLENVFLEPTDALGDKRPDHCVRFFFLPGAGQPRSRCRCLITQEIAVHGFVICMEKSVQHVENCVNTSVFARCCSKNIVSTVVFATRSTKHRKYGDFGLSEAQTTWVFTAFFCYASFKKYENTTYPTIFGHDEIEKKLQSQHHHHNNNNNNNNKKKKKTITP